MIHRGRRRIWIFVVVLGLYAAVGYFVLPPMARTELQKRAGAELGRTVSIGAVRIDPFAFSVALERVQIMNARGGEPFAGWRRLYVNLDPLRSLRGEWVLGEISLEDFRGAVEIDEQGTPSFSDLLERVAQRHGSDPDVPRAQARRSRPWRIKRLNVAGAQVDFVDRSRPEVFRTLVGPVDFTLLEFRTNGGHGAPYRFEARSESGEKLSWNGSLTTRPLTSAGEWRLENALLSKYAPYFDHRINVLLTAGKLTMSGRYDVSFLPDDRRVQVTEGMAQLSNLKLVERATGQPLLEVTTAELTGFTADGLQPRVSLGTIRLSGGRLAVRREPGGALNVSSLFRPRAGITAAPAVPAARENSANAKPLELTAAEIGLRDFVVQWHDENAPRPIAIELTGFNATLKEFTATPGATAPVEASFGVNPQGTARATGSIALQPFRLNLDLELAWIPLPPFSGYLEHVAPVRVSRGVASLRGRFGWSDGAAGTDATFTGGGRIEEVVLVGVVQDEELGGFSNLALNDVTIASTPRLSVSVGAANVSAPYARLVVDENGSLNLARLRDPRASGSPDVTLPAPEDGAGAVPLDRAIGRLTIDGGEVTYTDLSLQPPVQMIVSQIGGTVQNISSRNPARGEVDLRAFVGSAGPVLVRGRFNPFAAKPFADLAIEGKSIDLLPAGPYVAKYSGHELEQGTLFVEAQAKLIEQNLDLRSTVTLDDFTLGRASPGPEAVNLPVRLGVALLKDADGKIVLEMPVQGSFADPQFRPGRMVGQVLTNVLAKVATSPFAVIGSMFGGGGEELRYQEFQLGETTPSAASRQRLATLQRALVERPALQLELEAGYDPAELYELKRKALEERIRQRVWYKLKAADASVPPIEELLISSANRADAITRMFDERFGPPPAPREPPVAAPAAPPPRPQPTVGAPTPPAEEEPERPGLVKRAWNLATLRGVRERLWGDDEPESPPTSRPPETAAPAPRPELPGVASAAAPTEPARPAPRPALLDVSLTEMEQLLLDGMPVGPDDLTRLAEARAQRVKEILTEGGKVAPDRVQIAKIDADTAARGPRVTVHLR